MMKRRQFLTKSLMAGAWAALPDTVSALAETNLAKPTPTNDPGPLKTAGAKCGIKIGAQAEKSSLEVPSFAQVVKENFDLLTPGNELKWTRIRPTPDVFDFADGDWMVEFCHARGIQVHGHNLCWNSTANPSWFNSVLNKSNASRFLTEHITKVMRHYTGRIDSWDVVNEPITSWSQRSDGLYPGIWLNLLGPTYIDLAFHAAAAADPKPLRILNIYDVEQGTPDDDRTRVLTIELLKQLLARGVPLQAVGIESHLDAGLAPGDGPFRNFIRQIRDMGLEVLFTELDVNDTSVTGDFKQRDETVARIYRDYLTLQVAAANAKRLIFWTPTDKWDWMNSVHSPQYERADKTLHRPGLLDDNMLRKPAFRAVESALEELCNNLGST
jgi:endo-1,4-beta-xylanase